MQDGSFDFPDYSQIEDEAFPPLPPPDSPGQGEDNRDPFANGDEDGELSKLADVPVAKRKGVKRPQPKLDSQRLTSDRGLPALRTLFENVRFKGKGHEAEDLRLLMQKMENWAHRLYPKLQFEDFIDKVEKLGGKKEVQTCLKRIRLDMPLTHDDFIGNNGEEEAAPEPHVFGDPDPFGNDLPQPVHSTPAPTAPTTPATPSLTEEQRRRMEVNRLKALERRLARQQQEQQQTTMTDSKPLDSSLSADESVAASSENVLNNSETPDDMEEDLNLDLVSSRTQQRSQTPATDSETPEETSQTSKREEETSKPEEETIKRDEETSKREEETSKPEEETSKPEEETSKPEEETSKGEEETSKREEETSKREEETSKREEETSKREEETSKPEEETSHSQVHHISNVCEDEE